MNKPTYISLHILLQLTYICSVYFASQIHCTYMYRVYVAQLKSHAKPTHNLPRSKISAFPSADINQTKHNKTVGALAFSVPIYTRAAPYPGRQHSPIAADRRVVVVAVTGSKPSYPPSACRLLKHTVRAWPAQQDLCLIYPVFHQHAHAHGDAAEIPHAHASLGGHQLPNIHMRV